MEIGNEIIQWALNGAPGRAIIRPNRGVIIGEPFKRWLIVTRLWVKVAQSDDCLMKSEAECSLANHCN